jgi:hypothetical protein
MSLTARASLESLLRARKLDTTLTTAYPLAGDPVTRAASGLPALDGVLAGGLPRGQMSEIVGARSSGCTSVMHAVMTVATTRGELVALIDALDRFDPSSAAHMNFSQVLWVRGEDVPPVRFGIDPGWQPSRAGTDRSSVSYGRALDQAVKAFNLVLQAGGFGLVILDVADVPMEAIRRLPYTTWFRLQRVVEGSETASVLVVPEPIGRSTGGVTVKLETAREPQAGRPDFSFHDAVRASRRPFLPSKAMPDRPAPGAVAGLWAGPLPHARRFCGLAARAAVQCGLRAADCRLKLGSP